MNTWASRCLVRANAGPPNCLFPYLSLLFLVGLGACDSLLAQPPIPALQTAPSGTDLGGNADWQFRFDLFQMLLEQNGLEPIDGAELDDLADDDFEELVVVSLGRQDRNSILRRFRAIMQSGVVFVASDYPVRFEGLFEIRGGPVQSRTPEYTYRGFSDCILVNRFLPESELAANLNEIVVNRGGWLSSLSNRSGVWQIHAWYPNQVRPLESSGDPLLASFRPNQSTRDRMIVSADHSLFSNGMIWHGDNAMLAIQLSRELASGEGPRKMLFLVDGKPMPSYVEQPGVATAQQPPPIPDIPPEAIPEPTLEQMLKIANTVTAKVEDSDLLNEVIANQPRRILDRYYHRLLLLLAALLVLVYGIYRLSKPPAIATRPSPTLAIGGPPALDTSRDFATAEQRGIAARFLARDFFVALTGSSESQHWRERLREGMTEGKMSNAISYLLTVAQADHPPLLTEEQLVAFGTTLELVRTQTQ